MAILITVFQCDNCAAIAGLKTDDDWKQFEQTWFEGFYFQFCLDCSNKTETLERRLSDSKMIIDAARKCDEEQVLNAEFIQ